MRRSAVLLVAVLLLAEPAAAQHLPPGIARPWLSTPAWRGLAPDWHHQYGVDTGWSYYGVSGGPYVTVPPTRTAASPFVGGAFQNWWVPAATPSFWSNGRSLYGPPVPTYGPTPGVFRASDDDKRFFKNPPPASGVWFGLGWGGYLSPSPRHLPLSVSVFPPPSVAVVPGPPAVTADGALCLRLAVRLPDPNADVWVEKAAMASKGTDRLFESPPLADGQEYRYELVARWTENGTEKAESRVVVGKPGQTISVDFTRPEPVSPTR
jgi:uncharacterized protein (TIGR03000 family)